MLFRNLLLKGVMAFAVLSSSITVVETREVSNQVIVYHTNDMHGNLQESDAKINMAQVAGLKDQNPEAILVDAGDATQGHPLASLTKGKDVIELMNLAGYDVMGVGNHEFDYGVDTLLDNVGMAKFPVLAANVRKNGELLKKGDANTECHTIIERNGKRIGFFGLVTTQTKTATNPVGIAGIDFQDEVLTAKGEIEELEEAGVDAIIAITHFGNGDVPCTSAMLANALDGAYENKVTAIIDGHSHTVENEEVNGIQIVQTGYDMDAIGELTLTFDEEDQLIHVEEQLLHHDDMENVPLNQAVMQKLHQITDAQSDLLNQ